MRKSTRRQAGGTEGFLPALGGQGLVLGAGGLAPAYEGAGNIDMAHGSMAFWMRPLDWDNLTR